MPQKRNTCSVSIITEQKATLMQPKCVRIQRPQRDLANGNQFFTSARAGYIFEHQRQIEMKTVRKFGIYRSEERRVGKECQ
jgi:hypothetical protein